MKYVVKRACGHTESVQLFGARPERERRLAWLGRTLCRDCYRREQEAAAQELAQVNTGLDLVMYVLGGHAEYVPRDVIDKMAEAVQYVIDHLSTVPSAQWAEGFGWALRRALPQIWGGAKLEVSVPTDGGGHKLVAYTPEVFAGVMAERWR